MISQHHMLWMLTNAFCLVVVIVVYIWRALYNDTTWILNRCVMNDIYKYNNHNIPLNEITIKFKINDWFSAFNPWSCSLTQNEITATVLWWESMSYINRGTFFHTVRVNALPIVAILTTATNQSIPNFAWQLHNISPSFVDLGFFCKSLSVLNRVVICVNLS